MNTQNIYAGEYYAYSEFRPNKSFPMDARKGKAIKVIKKKTPFRERASAFVLMEIEGSNGVKYEREIRARDVVDFWDQYENERRGILKEREERQRIAEEQRERLMEEARIRREQAEEQRLARERVEEDKKDKLVRALLAKTAMPPEVLLSVQQGYVTLDRTSLELWLGVQNGSHSAG